MEPTNAEIIFYVVLAILGIAFLIIVNCANRVSDVDITWGQRRDWERREKEWYK